MAQYRNLANRWKTINIQFLCSWKLFGNNNNYNNKINNNNKLKMIRKKKLYKKKLMINLKSINQLKITIQKKNIRGRRVIHCLIMKNI